MTERKQLITRTLARKVAEEALKKKADNVILMDLRKLQAPADFFLVCSANSDTQVKSIADGVKDGLEHHGVSVWHEEGYQSLQWVLLDYVDVVVHVFHREIRQFYNIERLWSDAKIESVKDTPKGIRFEKIILSKKKKVLHGKPRRRAVGSR